MKAKKRSALLLAVLLLFAVSGCGGTGEETDPDTPDEGETVSYEDYAEVPVEYEKKDAEQEDEELSLWFDHSTAKTTRDTTEGTGRDTYKIYMGKNEKEDCQFFLSGGDKAKTFSLSVTDFVSGDGDAVPVFLYYEYYFSMTYEGEDNVYVPDAVPPVTEGETFTVAANRSQGFVLQAETDLETPAGDYEATLDVYDTEGNQIKTATVFLHVWDIELSEETACRTAMWIEEARLTSYGMDYQTVYDYLLDNRICAYDLPYELNDDGVDEYLDNPRVNSFNVLGYKYNLDSGYTETQIKNAMSAAYDKLSENESWMEKGYFYLVDEPTSVSDLSAIKTYAAWLEEYFPGYRQMSPFYTDKWYSKSDNIDWIEYLRDYINIWVPKTYAYTTLRQYGSITNAQMLYQEGYEGELDSAFGSYPSRIASMVEEDGDEAWWYVTSQPSDPYITLNTTEPGTAYRILFWQQKMNGVTGFLYWSVNYWDGNGWNNREAEWTDGTITYGNGQLIYSGTMTGSTDPVGSLRLESVRDGIEDYQMLTMLEEIVGGDEVVSFINRTTTHVAVWNSDADDFASERIILGNYLESLIAS